MSDSEVYVQSKIFFVSIFRLNLVSANFQCTLYRWTAVSAVGRGPKKIFWEIKEVNGSQVSKRAPRENGP
jgi:hypothetical protein